MATSFLESSNLLVCSENVSWDFFTLPCDFEDENIIFLLVISLLDAVDLHSQDPALHDHAVPLGDEGQHLILAALFRSKLELRQIVNKEVQLS